MSSRSKILVLLQLICFFYFFIRGELLASGIFLFVQLLGLFLGLWSIWVMKIGNFNMQPEVKRDALFVTAGPYRLIRNPMYVALILFFGSVVIPSDRIISQFVLLLLIIVFLSKIHMEEKFLTLRFGDTYLSYKKKTYRLIPYLY